MNLGVVTHIEYVQHLNVPNIGKAYHNSALNAEHSNWIDTRAVESESREKSKNRKNRIWFPIRLFGNNAKMP